MAANPPSDLVLTSTNGTSRTVAEWLTVFPLVFVAVDPFNQRSAWIVPTAARILTGYEQADCRVAWLVAGTAEEGGLFLGERARDILMFTDPNLEAVKGFGLETLPAIVHLAQDGTIVNAVEGWDPPRWRALAAELSRIMKWSQPVIPGSRDPGPFAGAPPSEPLPQPDAAVEAEAPIQDEGGPGDDTGPAAEVSAVAPVEASAPPEAAQAEPPQAEAPPPPGGPQ